MKVFKFGGASLQNADAVRNVFQVLSLYSEEKLMIVISAMGKTTNALEELVHAFYFKEGNPEQILDRIKQYHLEILNQLFSDRTNPIYSEVHNLFVEIEWQLEDDPIGSFDFEYDQMVAMGEMLSTKIVSAYLNQAGLKCRWLDARDLIRTDNSYRKAKVDWEVTLKQVQNKLFPLLNEEGNKMLISQGFIASTSENYNTTLGREGSDFSAAIFAYTLNAEEVIIWKDVDGMYNADPKHYENTSKLNQISYLEAIELSYYGASIIHAKTIKPLQNKQIPLHLKSFLNPVRKGTLISEETDSDALIPSFIHKGNQILISIAATDFSFIAEENLSEIYALFSKHGTAINLMQNSAISFSVCIDHYAKNTENLIRELQLNYKLTYNENLTLITIRHYTDDVIDELISGRKLFLEQRTRNTARYVASSFVNAKN